MSRRRRHESRPIHADPVYESPLVGRMIGYVLRRGKLSTASRLVYNAIKRANEGGSGGDPLAVVTKAVPAGATAVGNPARIIDAQSKEREAQAEKLGFSAYAVARDQDDPLAKAIHGLLDHAAETDRRLASLLKELEAQGVKCDQEVQQSDDFDAKYLSKIVD